MDPACSPAARAGRSTSASVKFCGHLDRETSPRRRGSPSTPDRFCSAASMVSGVSRRTGCAATPAVQVRRAREQQLQVVVQLGHRADGGARRAYGIGLVDRNGRRDAVDAVDLRLVHAVEKLPCVRRKRLDVAALAFRIDRVEDERGLPGARTRPSRPRAGAAECPGPGRADCSGVPRGCGCCRVQVSGICIGGPGARGGADVKLPRWRWIADTSRTKIFGFLPGAPSNAVLLRPDAA